MPFDEYIDTNHLKMDILHRKKKQFTLDDMEACWNTAVNTIAQLVIDMHNGKFEHLPHRLEDEQQ